MDKLLEKSIRTLELPKILDMLATHAVSRDAKRLAENLSPTQYIAEARERLDQTTAAWRLMSLKGGPPLAAVSDIGMNLKRAERGGSLSMPALLEVAALLGAVRRLKGYHDNTEGEKTVLDGYFWQLQYNQRVEEEIKNSILSEDEMADSASPELASIRRKIRIAGEKVREALRKIITSPTYSKHLQDNIITQRSGRFVVPVKSEAKNEIPGLVHDVSSTGSTFFIEPAAVVALNNEIRELDAREKEEIDRILARLSAEVGDIAGQTAEAYGAYIHLDFTFAKARLATNQRATEPVLSDGTELELKRARHPLLNRDTAVPITVRLGGDPATPGSFDTLVVTGPNTGGKTVTLKTIGLFSLMAACGLYIPAEECSRVPVWNGVYADIGDEQSIEQSLSTFSSHMTNIVGVLSQAGERSLILFDELGAGTDPVEGAALAISIILHARQLGACVAATTHYAELKEFALTTEGVENASCEFDVETLKPTYRLLIGVPGKSNAFAISKRLGLDDNVIAAAEGLVGHGERSFDAALSRLESEQRQLETLREEQATLRRQAADMANRARKFKSDAETEKSRARDRAEKEARKIIEQARAEVDAMFAEMEALRTQIQTSAAADTAEAMNALRSSTRQKLNAAERSYDRAPQTPKAKKPSRPIAVGDTVKIMSTGTTAEVASVSKDGKTLTVQSGAMTITLKSNTVELAADEEKPKGYVSVPKGELGSRKVKPELDLRGMQATEALAELNNYLDGALMSGLTAATIIHGKGTGVLRTAVREHLSADRRVAGFRDGRFGEGDFGVTIVEF